MRVFATDPQPCGYDRRDMTRPDAVFRDPAAARAGGLSLLLGGPLVALPLLVHPLPSGGFEEDPGVLASTPLWGAIHVLIAMGCAWTALGALLLVAAGGPRASALERWAWGATCIGMLFFSGVALVNAWVMHDLAARLAADQAVEPTFAAFNGLLVGFGWLGNPLFLAGLTVIAALELADPRLGMPGWARTGGLVVVVLSWGRGIGSALGVPALEALLVANVPAFLWLAWVGWATARRVSA
jgi:hypothetical protein